MPEEVWERFLDDTVGQIRASAPKEPSARARQVTRRLKEQDELAARRAKAARRRRWRWLIPGRGKGGYGTRNAWPSGPGGPSAARQRLSRTARTVVPLLVVLAVLLVVLRPALLTSWLPGHFGVSRPEPSVRLTPDSPAPSASAPASPVPTAARPFAGSPALNWADGATGIVLPAARPVGALTGAQVAAALTEAKQYIYDTELDPQTLKGRWPAAAAGLMAPGNGWSESVREDLAHPAGQHTPLGYLSRYDPHQLKLAGDVVKVSGTMTYAADKQGSVEIRTDYSFVYPFLQVHGGNGTVSRSIARQFLDLRVYPVSVPGSGQGRLWLQKTTTVDFNTSCGADDGFLHPGFGHGGPGAPTASRSADPYDLRVPLNQLPKACATSTRT